MKPIQFDPETDLSLAVREAAQMAQSASLLAREAADQYTQAQAKLRENRSGAPSIARAIRALIQDPRTGALQRNVPIEYEQSHRIAKIMGREPMMGYLWWPITRDLTAAVATGGGYLVDTKHPADAFVPAANAADFLVPLGVTRLQMTSNAQFVRMSGNVTVTHLTNEATQAAESTPAFVTAVGTPKTCAAYVEASHQWLLNASEPAERFLMAQMGAAVGAARATKIMQGTGASGEPLGMLAAGTGLTSASGASLTWNAVTQSMNDVSANNSIINAGSLGWALGAGAELVMQRREKAAGSGFILANGAIDNKRAAVSTAVPSTTAVYGDWSQVVVLEWSAIEIGTDKFGPAGGDIFRTGKVGIRCIYSYDVAVIRPTSFSVLTGVT